MNKELIKTITGNAIGLLKQLIAIPSFSTKEEKVAECIQSYFHRNKIAVHRSGNNVWCTNKYFDGTKPSILLNSHIDTVPPVASYSNDPFNPEELDGKIYGLGATDAGASLVSLIATFIYFYEKQNMKYNIVFAATAEEEISGSNGIESLFSELKFKNCFYKPGSFAIVGEPTQLQLATAEKGLLVLDCKAKGRAAHAASTTRADNAIHNAIESVNWFRNFFFNRLSYLLGDVKMNVTSIQTENKAHNIIPDQCSFVVDIRVTDQYTNDEILEIIQENTDIEIKPRSRRLRSTSISSEHPAVLCGVMLGKKIVGSPTLSDKALIPLPALKCGPGNSEQSHSANEYVLVSDIKEGIKFYTSLIDILITHKILKPEHV